MDTKNPDTFKDKKAFPVLKAGMSHKLVPEIKAMLRSQGHWTGSDSEDFGPKLKAAIQYYQSTHDGPNDGFLKGDGEVGPATWWALYNPEPRENGIKPIAVAVEEPKKGSGSAKLEQEFKRRYGGLSPLRQAFLRVLWLEYLKPVKEIPDGSNGGPEVNKYTAGIGRVYWCALFLSWCFKQAAGFWHKKVRRAGVMDWFNAGLEGGWAFKVNSGYKPKPGDFMVWRFAKGAGHISAIVAMNQTFTIFNTVGGNESNCVKLGKRVKANEPQLVGFINPFDDMKESMAFVAELLAVDEEKALKAGGTR